MASKASASIALFLLLNLLFFVHVSSCRTCPSPKPKPCKNPTPTPTPTPTPSTGTCPRDTLKLGACSNLLGGIVGAGTPANTPCCTLISGLTDLESAICLCTAIKANILGINLNVPVSLSLLVNTCGKNLHSGFQCS
ncbi:14 kDa proline-rich protein DC2.15-like [Macadamia integrifolia]|uniref:14 kDa proline-rich protein DC2.15-like n=1 Tax=Macadamia integrifolia TaxID=60698 RepID=UPI001C4E3410|nr:14 kDa proline-rich protein DC2.15-like [Macadamia integrifolia]